MYYPEELKIEIVEQVTSKSMTKVEANRRYGIKGHSTIMKWIKKYGYLPEQKQTGVKFMKKRIEESEERIRKLEKLLAEKELKLEEANLKAKFYETMIDIAEKDLKITIKKNIGQQQ